MDTISLVIASLLIIIPIFISYKESLELCKEIIISMIRAVVQLILVGYILNTVFGIDNPIFTIGLVLVMLINAAINTKNRGNGIKNVVFISFISMLIGTAIIMSVLVFSKAIKLVPNQVVPVAGMIISNAMIAIGLSYKNLSNSFKNRRAEVEVKLSLGADVKEASYDIIRESIKIAIMPTLDSAKTLGIVALPGTMTGLILAGTSPLVAIKFQIMVTFMILSSSSVATVLATYMSYKTYFNQRKQLK